MPNPSTHSLRFPIFKRLWKPAAVTGAGGTAVTIWFEEIIAFGAEILALIFLTIMGGGKKRYQLDKVFHISPFIGMDVAYDWRFSEPTSHLAIHMENLSEGQPFFDATMLLKRKEISGTALAQVLLQYPVMTARVIGAIHWQPLRLWMKGVPFHSHPKKQEASPDATNR